MRANFLRRIKKVPIGAGLWAGVAGLFLTGLAWSIASHEVGSVQELPEEEKAEGEGAEKYIVLSKEVNAQQYYESVGLVPQGGNVLRYDSTTEVDDFDGAIVVCDRQPPLRVAAQARRVTVVPFALGKGANRGKASVQQLAQAAGKPQHFRASEAG